MAFQYSKTTECSEVFATRREGINAESPASSVRLVCDDNLRHQLAIELLLWRVPFPWNDLPDSIKLYASSVVMVPDRARYQALGTGQVLDPLYGAYVDVTYTGLDEFLWYANQLQLTAPNDTMQGIISTKDTMEPRVNMLTFDYRHFRWKSDEKQWDRGNEGGWRDEELVITRTVKGYFAPPATLTSWEGSTNQADWYSDELGLTFQAGTLLVGDVKVNRSYSNMFYKGKTWDVSATLTYRRDGWEKFPRLVCTPPTGSIKYEEVQVSCKDTAAPVDFKPFEKADLKEFLFSTQDTPNPVYYPDLYWTI